MIQEGFCGEHNEIAEAARVGAPLPFGSQLPIVTRYLNDWHLLPPIGCVIPTNARFQSAIHNESRTKNALVNGRDSCTAGKRFRMVTFPPICVFDSPSAGGYNSVSSQSFSSSLFADDTEPEEENVKLSGESNQVVRILHISDIHRAPAAPTSNTTLIGKLIDDIRLTYNEDNEKLLPAEPRLGEPDLIVVSGDLTQHADPVEYQLALQFLEGLLPLVDDDRHRVIIVPGNHDVNWAIGCESYVAATEDEFKHQPVPGEPYHQSVKRAPDGTYWRKDSITYPERFNPYKTFFDSFYQGAFTFPLVSEDMFTVHDFADEYGLVIVAINSCYEIDGYSASGKLAGLDRRAFLNTDAMYKAAHQPGFHPDRSDISRIAVFHHNIRSVDYHEDFLDPKYLQILVRHGYHLCLHGHVHTASQDVFDPSHPTALPVVGAGSLAAPHSDRPPATPMGYNVFVIDRLSVGSGSTLVGTTRTAWSGPPTQRDGKPYFVARQPTMETVRPATHPSGSPKVLSLGESIPIDPRGKGIT